MTAQKTVIDDGGEADGTLRGGGGPAAGEATTTESQDESQDESRASPQPQATAAQVSALHDLIAGGVAGSASVVVGHPFDTIKVRMQASSGPSSAGGGSSSSGGALATTRGLFKGMLAPLSTAAIVNAIIFAGYGSCTRWWEDAFENGKHPANGGSHGAMTGEGAVFVERDDEVHGVHEQAWRLGHAGEGEGDANAAAAAANADAEIDRRELRPDSVGNDDRTPPGQSFLKVFACGAAAGTFQSVVICPMEHVKCRLQVASAPSYSGPRYKGPFDAALSITKDHGLFRGLYRGAGVTLWRETPAFGLYFATYDAVKGNVEGLLERWGDAKDVGDDDDDARSPAIPSHARAWAASALAGGVSGAWTWAVIYPFDVIKTRMQTGPLKLSQQKGMWTVAGDIIREDGWRRMFRGLGVTLARAFPVNAIIFPVYEFVLIRLGDGG
ncbi:hypothetical protein ACHAWF_017272 [Thalassiosira exigua]